MNNPSVQATFTVSDNDNDDDDDDAAGLEPLIQVVDKDGQTTHLWGGSNAISAGATLSTDLIPFNESDQLRIHLTGINGLSIASLKVNKCAAGVCQLLDVLTHEGKSLILTPMGQNWTN